MGCPKCANKNITTDEFVEKAKKIHDNKYDYSLVEYKKSNQSVEIICPIHGKFKQAPSNHQSGSGCPFCNESKGEKEINKYLLKNKIKFERQKRFNTCRNIKPLPFDFYLLEHNICIEFDGFQHFIIHEKWGGKIQFEKIQKRDQIKNNFCKNNNIKLIRIKYDENINQKLDQIFKNE